MTCNKIYTYKIKYETYTSYHAQDIVRFLFKTTEIKPTSIMNYGYFKEKIKFKYRGTEKQLREFLISIDDPFKIKSQKIKKLWSIF